MRKILPVITLVTIFSTSYGQVMSLENILISLMVAEKKQEGFYTKKGFISRRNYKISDTLIRVYDWDCRLVKKKLNDSIKRRIIKKTFKGFDLISYQTASAEECKALKTALLNEGFYFVNDSGVVLDTTPLLYQHNNITSQFSIDQTDSIKLYSFQFSKKDFPKPRDMYYADNLLHFTSHEYLVYYFGERNVKKDICFFSDNQIARCSVLFSNTNRQVVFIWQDELNRSNISSLLIGGRQKLKSQQDYDKYIAESNWLLKSGIHAGMPLNELRLLHGANLNFYGGNALTTGEVIENYDGKLDFKKESIILGCLNCRDKKFAQAAVINADDAIREGRILFILSVIVKPSLDLH